MAAALVLNAGSSSLKWVVLDARTESIRQHGSTTWKSDAAPSEHQAALESALHEIQAIDAVGHRVVHGGARFQSAVIVDDATRDAIQDLSELAPLHNPAAVAGIDAARARFGPSVPQVAVFDTAFHATIPAAAALYPLPWEWTEQWGLRRFGFHGLSVQYAVEHSAELLGSLPRRLVVCHLGAGCSVTAVAEGQSVDTSMGFTPLEGLMMATRSGSVDPGLLLYLMRQHDLSVQTLEQGLEKDSGLAGVSGVASDLRDVLAAAEAHNERAGLAIDMFVHRVVATIGSMTATLGGLDALVFTGGIGEHGAAVRERVVSKLRFLGAQLDLDRNASVGSDSDVAHAASAVRVLVITAREDLVVLHEMKRLLG
jgi:acetate kinase